MFDKKIKLRGSDIRLDKTLDDADKPISEVYPVIDTDLGRDNVENDIPDADLQDL